MTEEIIPSIVDSGAQALVDNAERLGLTWTLRLATITLPSPPIGILDGDTTAIDLTSMIGGLFTGQRVYVLIIPPGGNFIVGSVGNAGRTVSAAVDTQESTTSTSYTDLATAGPIATNVLVGESGQCLVIVSCEIQATLAAGSAIKTVAGHMNFATTGATTLGTPDRQMAEAWIGYDASPNSTMALDIRASATRVNVLTGLNSGLHTFTAKYKCTGDGATFAGRNITAIPL